MPTVYHRSGHLSGYPIEIKAISTQEAEATQQKEEVTQLQATVAGLAEAFKKYEEHAQQAAQEGKKHEEEADAQIAAVIKKQQEAETAAKKAQEEVKSLHASLTRAQLLAHALRQCEKQPKSQRARCVASADKRYGAKAAATDRHRRRPAA